MAARKSAARSKGARLFIDGMTASCLAAPSGQLPKPEGGTAAWRAGVDGEGAGQAIMLSPDNGGGNAGGALVGGVRRCRSRGPWRNRGQQWARVR